MALVTACTATAGKIMMSVLADLEARAYRCIDEVTLRSDERSAKS